MVKDRSSNEVEKDPYSMVEEVEMNIFGEGMPTYVMTEEKVSSESKSETQVQDLDEVYSVRVSRPYVDSSRFEIYKIILPAKSGVRRVFLWHPSISESIFVGKASDTETKDLTLCGPSHPVQTYNPLIFEFYGEDDCLWGFQTPLQENDIKKDVVLSLISTDGGNKATILFERISESIEAFIEISIPGSWINAGVISATTDGKDLTQRILLRSTNFEFDDNNILRLDRSALAMPLDSSLHLHFDLIGMSASAKGEVRIPVPKHASEISGVCNLELVFFEAHRKSSNIDALQCNIKVKFESYEHLFMTPEWVAENYDGRPLGSEEPKKQKL